MEIVKYSIRKNEMMASVMCIGAERRGAPYADAQYWGRYGYGRYGRCIVKGYSDITLQQSWHLYWKMKKTLFIRGPFFHKLLHAIDLTSK